MPSIDTALGTLTVPIWAAGAVCAVFVVALVLAVKRAGAATLISAVFRVGIVLVAAYAGWIYLQRASAQDEAAERRSLDERSAALMARAIAPGSALSCLDELASEPVETACEKGVFASPEAVAAAVSYVTAKLALLADGTQHMREVNPTFAADLVPLRAGLELDRFGIVAHVLAKREGCSAEKCDALARFTDSSHVLANLRDHTFDDEVTKFTALWNAPKPEPTTIAAAPPTAPVPSNLTPPPASVSPRYDFPSSQSIPPVSIMANEPRGAPAGGTAAQAAPGDPNATPVPPRRPPQVRSAPRPAVARPDDPLVPGPR
jgi:hypothetical protein